MFVFNASGRPNADEYSDKQHEITTRTPEVLIFQGMQQYNSVCSYWIDSY